MSDMGHCYGNDLRRRVVEAITGRLSARGAAARFRVAPATAIHWHRRWRETGSIEPDRQGQPPGSKLDAHEAFILALVAQTKAMTLAEIGEKLAASHGVRVCPSTVWHFFAKRGLTHKKDRPCSGAAAPGRARAAPALVRRPGRARSGTADLHRPDRRVDEDGAAAGMVAQRRTVPGLHRAGTSGCCSTATMISAVGSMASTSVSGHGDSITAIPAFSCAGLPMSNSVAYALGLDGRLRFRPQARSNRTNIVHPGPAAGDLIPPLSEPVEMGHRVSMGVAARPFSSWCA